MYLKVHGPVLDKISNYHSHWHTTLLSCYFQRYYNIKYLEKKKTFDLKNSTYKCIYNIFHYFVFCIVHTTLICCYLKDIMILKIYKKKHLTWKIQNTNVYISLFYILHCTYNLNTLLFKRYYLYLIISKNNLKKT